MFNLRVHRINLFLIIRKACTAYVLNMFISGLPMERTFLWTSTPPMGLFVGIIISVACGRDRGVRVRDAFSVGMRCACLNRTIIGYTMSGGKREISRVKVCPFLYDISSNPCRGQYSTYFGLLSK